MRPVMDDPPCHAEPREKVNDIRYGLLGALVFGIYLASSSNVFAITSAQMQEAIRDHQCPATATEIFLRNYNSCGPEGSRPDEKSESYIHCRSEIDAENNTIAAYNDFVRNYCPSLPKLEVTRVPIDRLNALRLVEPYAHAYPPQQCYRQDGLVVCLSSKEYNNSFKDLHRDQCLDIRKPTGEKGAQICHQPSDYFFDRLSYPDYTFDYCVDVVCIPKDVRPYN